MLLKVFITFGLRSKNNLQLILVAFLMLLSNSIFAQQSLNFFGINSDNNLGFRLNSINSNIGAKINTKDWEFTISSNSQLAPNFTYNPKYFAMGKRYNNHYIYLEYSPGIEQKFVFSSGTKAIIGDSVQNFYSSLNYSKKYGAGYTFELSNSITFGFSFNYFEQNFVEEYPTFFSDSTQQIWLINEETISKNFWKGDIGFSYSPSNVLSFVLMSNNLLILKDFEKEANSSSFEIRTNKFNIRENKNVILGVNYSPSRNLSFNSNIETSTSFSLGFNYLVSFGKSRIVLGNTFFHDKYQQPFMTGILPSLNYSTKLFSLTLSYIKYFSDRSTLKTVDQFNKFHIHNIENNYFSSDNLSLNFNFALSFQKEQLVKILEIEILKDIYPTFTNNYIDQPFAIAKVVNLTSENVTVKPSSFIKGINSDKVYSPLVNIGPNDTLMVPYFTLVENNSHNFTKTKISKAEFYLLAKNDKPDDELQKPILINDINSWDGNVHNLRYFVKADLGFSHEFAGKIISNIESSTNISPELIIFEKTKILFANFVKNMSYVSDRRASVDHVQFPNETISLKGGDCDDLSVCFSSLLESVGIQTAFIDYKPNGTIGHVTLFINTNLSPEQSDLITINDRKFLIRKNVSGRDEVWIPLEITSLTNFEEAWNIAAQKFYKEAIDNFGLSKNKVEIVDIY